MMQYLDGLLCPLYGLLYSLCLLPFLSMASFFGCSSSGDDGPAQIGTFRTNCMDCLDRTNVVQGLLAAESLRLQLEWLGLPERPDRSPEFLAIFKNLWADNGDECSVQYAGTGALKTDFTRFGRRTFKGAFWDGINAVTRYFRNNFNDGYRQDSIDLLLGHFRVDVSSLPSDLEQGVLTADWHGAVLFSVIVAATMTVLCLSVAGENAATYALFWLVVFVILIVVVIIHGEEFVNIPKLKPD